jgi:hypothetical protein
MLVVAPAGPADYSHPLCEAFALGNMQCLQALSMIIIDVSMQTKLLVRQIPA